VQPLTAYMPVLTGYRYIFYMPLESRIQTELSGRRRTCGAVWLFIIHGRSADWKILFTWESARRCDREGEIRRRSWEERRDCHVRVSVRWRRRGQPDPREMISIYSINDARNDRTGMRATAPHREMQDRLPAPRSDVRPELINARVSSFDFAGCVHVEDGNAW